MFAPEFQFKSYHLVVTGLTCVSPIYIFFFLLLRWSDGQPTTKFDVPRCLVSFKDHRSNMN